MPPPFCVFCKGIPCPSRVGIPFFAAFGQGLGALTPDGIPMYGRWQGDYRRLRTHWKPCKAVAQYEPQPMGVGAPDKYSVDAKKGVTW